MVERRSWMGLVWVTLVPAWPAWADWAGVGEHELGLQGKSTIFAHWARERRRFRRYSHCHQALKQPKATLSPLTRTTPQSILGCCTLENTTLAKPMKLSLHRESPWEIFMAQERK